MLRETGSPQKTLVAVGTFTGTATNHLRCERDVFISDAEEVQAAKLLHHVLIVDRSGSMSYDIGHLKDMLIQTLTLEEFLNDKLLVSLISYSSEGDVTLHFERAPISRIMQRDSKEIAEIRRIRACYLTGISQALKMAEKLCADDEMTGITLHSDGYANDPSPASERRSIESVCERLAKKNVFVNTIAYSNYSDFGLLDKIASSVSGRCARANNAKEVCQALTASTRALVANASQTLELPLNGAYYMVYVDRDSERVIGGSKDMTVRGVSTSANASVYRYYMCAPLAETDLLSVYGSVALLALARAKLAEGKLNDAKMAMAWSGQEALANRHMRALTANQIAALAKDLDDCILQGKEVPGLLPQGFCLKQTRTTVVSACQLLEKNRKDILVHMPDLKNAYKLRGLRRRPGTRDADGHVTEPWVDTESTMSTEWAHMGTFEFSHESPTVNMLIAQPIRLVNRETRKPIEQVAGIMLDKLSDFRNYTVVGDGEVTLPQLHLRFATPKAFEELRDTGYLGYLCDDSDLPFEARKFDPEGDYYLDLQAMNVCGLNYVSPTGLRETFRRLAVLKTLSSIMSACIKEEALTWTPEQKDALKKHYLSEKLYVNMPTTSEYDDLKEAIVSGAVDSRIRFRVTLGDAELALNLDKLKSANAFLQRLYSLNDGGAEIGKPDFGMWMLLRGQKGAVTHKKLSARTKITSVDTFQQGVFDAWLCVGKSAENPVDDALGALGATALRDIIAGGWQAGDEETVKALAEAQRLADDYADELWLSRISPLAFYVGATGLLPTGLEADALDAEALLQKYPELSISKSEMDGTFFVLGDVILSVFCENVHYTVDRKSVTADEVEMQESVADPA